jgi:diaminohydroxyphosphoribosylaminopyrimidine deaminase/5-amino-6-(5-phosphoribosylamino)uracil reductase
LLREGCVDELLIYLNPSLLGDSAQGMVNLQEMTALDQRVALKVRSFDRIGEDLRIVARLA